MTRFPARWKSVAVLLLLSRAACSQDAAPDTLFPFCPATFDVPPRPVVDEQLEPGDVHVLADHVDMVEGGVSHLQGNVQVTRDAQQATADEVYYSEPGDNADLSGNIHYWDDTIYLHSDTAHLEFDDKTGTAEHADYRILSNRGRGQGDKLFMEVDKITRGENIDFSTCEPEAEGVDLSSNTWKIWARELVLNHETERGVAKNMVLRIKDVPVLYMPYLSFPLSKKRKSGFLMPAFGSTSNHGFEARTPYYLNIAPQFDATLTPRVLTDSGVMGMGEFRYLFEHAEGRLDAEYLPSDNKFDDKDRSYISFTHDQTFGSRTHLFATYNRASDQRYLEDFGNQLSVTSARYLERRAELSYRGPWWKSIARVQDYQTMDESIPVTSRPYKRLPQIRVDAFPLRGANTVNFQTRLQFDYMDRQDNNVVPDVHGARVDLYPFLSYPLKTRGTWFTPGVGLQFTQYSLEASGPFKSSPSRLLPSASVDTGLFLEREFTVGDSSYLQTLEPRLFYLYVPDHNQLDLPVFDTSVYNLSYDGLFRRDRFTAPDRVGDANQVTLALSNRFIESETGNEMGYFRVAETLYLADVNVVSEIFNPAGQLVPVGPTTDDALGPVIAEAGTRVFTDWNIHGEVHWRPSDNITEKLALRAVYHPADGRILNLAYRVRRAPTGEFRRNPTDIDQTDVSFRWPVSPQWSVVGRWNYAVSEDKSLELFGGVEYESCCFGIRAVARRFLNNLDGDYSTGIYLQVELKGLAGIGKQTTDFLSQHIPGYETEF